MASSEMENVAMAGVGQIAVHNWAQAVSPGSFGFSLKQKEKNPPRSIFLLKN